MPFVSIILRVIFWAFVVLLVWFIFVETVVRIIRRYVHFPIPAFAARFIDNPIRRRLQPPQKVVNWINIQDGMYVLEIGPGPGTFTIEAAKHAGRKGKVFALDIEPKLISKLKNRLKKEEIANVMAIVASAHQLPFPNNVFDRVFMITVLAEIPDKRRTLLEVKRVLKNSGILAVGEFLLDPDYPRRKTVTSWCKNAGLQMVNGYGGILHYVLTFKKQL